MWCNNRVTKRKKGPGFVSLVPKPGNEPESTSFTVQSVGAHFPPCFSTPLLSPTIVSLHPPYHLLGRWPCWDSLGASPEGPWAQSFPHTEERDKDRGTLLMPPTFRDRVDPESLWDCYILRIWEHCWMVHQPNKFYKDCFLEFIASYTKTIKR